ncbi:alpha/beta fold hydrolase [Trinickia diaoshuihuensis]|uniref:alpha/beta fold hydrolase n=1 Tax=Trinickia diaoshuihuensis TaxID=2292265 RepID=UPI000E236700|nr:alpha/beta fold hydrolase [Trinickia diaoshuihuensis]
MTAIKSASLRLTPTETVQVTRIALRRDGYRIACTVAGAAGGEPVVVLHGGPGSGSQPSVLRLVDLARLCVVLVDQRGTGASAPGGSVRQNRTDRLIADMEAVRRYLGYERWGVVGGSWGAALALAYAGTHPERVTGVVLRGTFLTSARQVRGFLVESRKRAPRPWRALCRAARCADPLQLLRCCAKALDTRSPFDRRRDVALSWNRYEDAVLGSAAARRRASRARLSRPAEQRLIRKYHIQAHYLTHHCWLGEPRLMRHARRASLSGVPIAAVHGTLDPVCPIEALDRLARAVPGIRAMRVRAGHLGSEPALAAALAREIETMFVRTP